MGALLGVLALCGAVGWWAGTLERAQIASRTLRIEAPVSPKEPWESDGGDTGYTVCPKCGERAAFIDSFDGLLACMMCKDRFHPDFDSYVRTIPTSDKAA